MQPERLFLNIKYHSTQGRPFRPTHHRLHIPKRSAIYLLFDGSGPKLVEQIIYTDRDWSTDQGIYMSESNTYLFNLIVFDDIVLYHNAVVFGFLVHYTASTFAPQ